LAPDQGWIKLNDDVGYNKESGLARVGVIVRDEANTTVLTTWRILCHCGSPEEAEDEACLEGIRLVVKWIRKPTWSPIA
jgi:hypothetical protein